MLPCNTLRKLIKVTTMKRQHEDTTAPGTVPEDCALPETSSISETEKKQKREKQSELSSSHDLCAPITIQDLKSLKLGRIFHGDVLVIYKTIVDQVHGIQLLRADLDDSKGNMAITLNVPHNLIPTAEEKLVVGQGICIKDFKVSPKTVYDHGDCSCILVLHEKSIIETIPAVCTQYTFVPTTTISQLTNTTGFAIGTVAGLVTSAKEIGGQYVLNIKDGQSQKDTTTVYLFSTFKPIFKLIQQQISKQEAPMVLFRNLVRGPYASRFSTHMQSHFHNSGQFEQSTSRPQQTSYVNNKGQRNVNHSRYTCRPICHNLQQLLCSSRHIWNSFHRST